MAWIKVDERFFMSTVALGHPLAAVLYLEALTYCMRMNYDYFPTVVAKTLWNAHGKAAVVRELDHLVNEGVFTPCDGGFTLAHRWVEDDVVIESPGEWGTADVISHQRASGYECAHCGTTEGLQVDHIVPRSRGGCSRPANLQTLCGTCNIRKGSRVPWGNLRGGSA